MVALLLSAAFSVTALAANELEPNDNYDEAMDILLGTEYKGSVGPMDVDVYQFKATVNGAIHLVVNSTTELDDDLNLFYRISYYDEENEELKELAYGYVPDYNNPYTRNPLDFPFIGASYE